MSRRGSRRHVIRASDVGAYAVAISATVVTLFPLYWLFVISTKTPREAFKSPPDLIYIQVTSTVGNTKEQKLAFFRHMADELNRRLSVRREDVFISLVFVDREDWSFGNGEPW